MNEEERAALKDKAPGLLALYDQRRWFGGAVETSTVRETIRRYAAALVHGAVLARSVIRHYQHTIDPACTDVGCIIEHDELEAAYAFLGTLPYYGNEKDVPRAR